MVELIEDLVIVLLAEESSDEGYKAGTVGHWEQFEAMSMMQQLGVIPSE